jgi:hypothetical protein
VTLPPLEIVWRRFSIQAVRMTITAKDRLVAAPQAERPIDARRPEFDRTSLRRHDPDQVRRV